MKYIIQHWSLKSIYWIFIGRITEYLFLNNFNEVLLPLTYLSFVLGTGGRLIVECPGLF